MPEHPWGCQCFVVIPPELCLKGGPHRFEANFVGYVENRLSWCVRDPNKYHFSHDVLLNDLVPGLLSSFIPFHLLPPLILFMSSLQLTVKHSMMLLSFETITIQEALWICLFLTIHRLLVPQPFPFLCDNQNTLTLIESEAISSHSKFKRLGFLFTKPLLPSLFLKHHDALCLVSYLFPFLLTFYSSFPFCPDGGVLADQDSRSCDRSLSTISTLLSPSFPSVVISCSLTSEHMYSLSLTHYLYTYMYLVCTAF